MLGACAPAEGNLKHIQVAEAEYKKCILELQTIESEVQKYEKTLIALDARKDRLAAMRKSLTSGKHKVGSSEEAAEKIALNDLIEDEEAFEEDNKASLSQRRYIDALKGKQTYLLKRQDTCEELIQLWYDWMNGHDTDEHAKDNDSREYKELFASKRNAAMREFELKEEKNDDPISKQIALISFIQNRFPKISVEAYVESQQNDTDDDSNKQDADE